MRRNSTNYFRTVAIIAFFSLVTSTVFADAKSKVTLEKVIKRSEVLVKMQVTEKERTENNLYYEYTLQKQQGLVGTSTFNEINIKLHPGIVYGKSNPKLNKNQSYLFFLSKDKDSWKITKGAWGVLKLEDDKIKGVNLTYSDFAKAVGKYKSGNSSEFSVKNEDKFLASYKQQSSSCRSYLNGEFCAGIGHGPSQSITLKIDASGATHYDGSSMSFNEVKDAVKRSVNTWNNVQLSPDAWSVASNEYSLSYNPGDGVSTITFADIDYPAFIDPTINSDDEIVEVDLVFASKLDGKELRWNPYSNYPSSYNTYKNTSVCGTDDSYNPDYIGPFDLENVVTHELGHGTGLNHINKSKSTMYVNHICNNTDFWERTEGRSLTNGDKSGRIFAAPDFSGSSSASISIVLGGPKVVNINNSFDFADLYIKSQYHTSFELLMDEKITANSIEAGRDFGSDNIILKANKDIDVYDRIKFYQNVTSKHSSNSKIRAGDFDVYGESNDKVIFKTLSNSSSWEGIEIDGLYSDINNAKIIDAVDGVTHYGGVTTIKNSTIKNSTYDGIYTNGDRELTIKNTTIKNNGNNGVTALYSGTVNFESVSITGNDQDGLEVYETDVSDLYKTVIQDNSSGYNYGLEVANNSFVEVSSPSGGDGHTRIKNNTQEDEIYVASNATSYGVMLGDNSTGSGGYNDVYNNGQAAYYVNNNTSYTVPANFTYWGTTDQQYIDLLTINTDYSYYTSSENTSGSGASKNKEISYPELQNEVNNKKETPETISHRVKEKTEQLRKKLLDGEVTKETPKRITDLYTYFHLVDSDRKEKEKLMRVLDYWRQKFRNIVKISDQQEKSITQKTGEKAVLYTIKEYFREEKAQSAIDLINDYTSSFNDPDRLLHLRLNRVSAHIYAEDYSRARNVLENMKPYLKENDGMYDYRKMSSFLDRKLDTNGDGKQKPTFAKDKSAKEKPAKLKLHDAYPNPFNPITVINYSLPSEQHVKLNIYNVMGKKIETLVDGRKEAGKHTVNFKAENLASGVYLYRLKTNNKSLTKRMTLIK